MWDSNELNEKFKQIGELIYNHSQEHPEREILSDRYGVYPENFTLENLIFQIKELKKNRS